jgi:hypothetical protein
MDKGREGRESSVVRQLDFQGNSATFTTKEPWTFSEDGQMLNLQRTIQTPIGTDKIELSFKRDCTPKCVFQDEKINHSSRPSLFWLQSAPDRSH